MTTPHRKHLRPQVRALAKRALKPSSPERVPEMLTTAEIELLRQDLKTSSAAAMRAFRRKPLVGKPK